MARDSILLDKSLKFAARIVKLHKFLIKEKHESIISKQIIRSATSIGANANEAIYGQSKADFLAKLHISLKETAETEYWLRLLVLSDYITETEGKSLIDDCLEIKRILISSINTSSADVFIFAEEVKNKAQLIHEVTKFFYNNFTPSKWQRFIPKKES